MDENGCCLDSDRDGVIDCRDKCPKTPAGVKVDERGCWVISTVVLFDFDKADLKPEAAAELDQAYDILKDDDLKIEIQGHTCNMGPDAYNQKLQNAVPRPLKTIWLIKESMKAG